MGQVLPWKPVALHRRNSAAILNRDILANLLDAIKMRGNIEELVPSERRSGQSHDW
jgi:hypothetical protein